MVYHKAKILFWIIQRKCRFCLFLFVFVEICPSVHTSLLLFTFTLPAFLWPHFLLWPPVTPRCRNELTTASLHQAITQTMWHTHSTANGKSKPKGIVACFECPAEKVDSCLYMLCGVILWTSLTLAHLIVFRYYVKPNKRNHVDRYNILTLETSSKHDTVYLGSYVGDQSNLSIQEHFGISRKYFFYPVR